MGSAGISSASSTGGTQNTNDTSFNFTKKSDGNLDFGKMMTQSMHSNRNSNISQSDSSKKITKISTNVESKAKESTVTNSNDSTNDTSVNKKLNQSDISNETDSVNDSQANDVLDNIKEQIKKTFGLTEEELEVAMQNIGVSMQDLLVPNNLTNLVAELTGTEDTLALLTDGDLSSQLKSLMDYVDTQISTLAKELNVSDEDVKAYIENMTLQQGDADVQTEIQAQTQAQTVTAQAITVEENVIDNQLTNTETSSDDELTVKANNLETVVESKLTVESEATANNSTEDSLMNSKEGKSNSNNLFTNVSNNLAQSIENAFQNLDTQSTEIDAADVIRQIVDAVKATTTQELTSMEIQLNPENLGKINLTVVAKDGMITAQLTAQNEAVKKAIENQIVALKERFSEQGIKVDAVEVTIASHSFESNQNLGKGDSNQADSEKKASRLLRLDSLDDLSDDELSEEERRIKNMFVDENNSVDYTA